MSSTLQVLLNLIMFVSIVAIWIRLLRPAKDDPRMSRGLQLLQSKIAILEDLSDRIEKQVQQSLQLIESKSRDVQTQVDRSDLQIQKIDSAMAKSLDVAKMFQDRIPHEEIIDRKNTVKYVKAARMAHSGVSANEIVQELGMSLGEVDFVVKMNREKLQFSEEDLPEWAKETEDFSAAPAFELPQQPLARQQPVLRPEPRVEIKPQPKPELIVIPKAEALPSTNQNEKVGKDVVRKVVFPRVDATRILT